MQSGHRWARGGWTKWCVLTFCSAQDLIHIFRSSRSKHPRASLSSQTMVLPFSRVYKLCTPLQRWYVMTMSSCFRFLTGDQLVDLSAAQDVEAGDGTTSVVVLAGSLLGAAEKMLQKGIHPTIIAESFQRASAKAVEYLTELSTPINLDDKTALLRAATTSLNSKVSLLYPSL